MKPAANHILLWILLLVSGVISITGSLALGPASVPLSDLISWLLMRPGDAHFMIIISELRWPRTLAGIVAGSGLGIAGLMMQTLFRNPIAGPYVLGISAGASLGVAAFIMAGTALGLGYFGQWGLILSAFAGAAIMMVIMLIIAGTVQDIAVLLIAGLMMGMGISAVVTVLQYYSGLEELRQYVIWTFGSLAGVSSSDTTLLSVLFVGLAIAGFLLYRSLNTLLLGENYALTMGVNVLRLRYSILLITAGLTALVTAYCGPVAFVGIAVPHMARMLFKTNRHQILIPACMLCGTVIMLMCDLIARGTLGGMVLPLNAITSMLGAPLVVWLAIKSYKFM